MRNIYYGSMYKNVMLHLNTQRLIRVYQNRFVFTTICTSLENRQIITT